ncbi:bifunctional glutamate N-acetyltransferase/amino-acid acetyltransferase ArgJ [Helicobacter sp. MIT 99-5507]|uniref:bifunctional glutamate N-acetyltransferase/amino-acid acetyltransferase ArgJ n=1 Tax=Helicobacter sp. MIT 99-5507 TaxID=152489 RepID=UPI000E1F7D2F|nr:bifunctional glutamate N-acetyltransferase/amino-acid acetyltransferase ArgJ [Helicobacter sp. MIT 99-5507]RDU57960.1 bifunctional ornithine acetyltransferase/N-acetylglutamate synthase [Helicobacter sp. MIT 99-5507]
MFDIIPLSGGISVVDGIYCDGVHCGLKANNALDLAFIYSDTMLDVESIFTNNIFKAAPIEYYLRNTKGKQSNFVLINTKNANAMTGDKGIDDVGEVLNALESKFKNIKNPIFSSTGVIGQYLPKEKILSGFNLFNLESKNHTNASNAILTTDRFSKEVAFRVDLKDSSFKIGAMAKGAGMINPAMATMLCFITTDANIPKDDMKELLNDCAKNTFNAISVDGDTSTNDSVFLMTNKKSNAYNKEAFKMALDLVMKKLSLDILKDGEGSSKVVAFEVIGAKNDNEAMICAKALSNSLLVKTALFGGDPNWGRIASTIGSCGIYADPNTLKIYIGDVIVYDCQKIYFESEEKTAKIMQMQDFKITCDLGVGNGKFIAYGCDLGYKYVEINSDYRS